MINCKGERESAAVNDTSAWPSTFGYGRLASVAEIDSLNTDVRPDGEGLKPGSGDALQGKTIYIARCAICHGKTGVEGPYSKLVARYHDPHAKGEKAIGNYWPYATTLYDYIYRAMPYNSPGTLTTDEVYSLVAFLLYRNDIIDSTAVMDAQTLPQVEMPAKKLFIDDDRRGGPEVR
ncbi:MAG TPA: c-type cytochrome [Ohtaekwangia sp.]|uniref:c-type cytochrome n=1 Tax=Ohtaekwangia sp. TaxID=2066019 RepID=UPI002F920C71